MDVENGFFSSNPKEEIESLKINSIPVEKIQKNKKNILPINYTQSTFFSKIFYFWANPILALANKRPLENEDVCQISQAQSVSNNFEKFKKIKKIYYLLIILNQHFFQKFFIFGQILF
jgi:hypothetical protein